MQRPPRCATMSHEINHDNQHSRALDADGHAVCELMVLAVSSLSLRCRRLPEADRLKTAAEGRVAPRVTGGLACICFNLGTRGVP